MNGVVCGAGLVGCFLAAAGGFTAAVPRPSGRPLDERICLPNGEVQRWRPRSVHLPCAAPVLVATRCGQTPDAQLDPQRTLLAQNGLGQELPTAACFFAVDRDDDGVIFSSDPAPRVVLSDAHGIWTPTIAAWRASGLRVELVTESGLRAARWEKCLLNATVGPLCLATGMSMAAVWRDRELRARVLATLDEGAELAARMGITLAADWQQRACAFFARVGEHRPSILDAPDELAWVFPPLFAAGERCGMDLPALRRIADQVESAVEMS